MWCSVVSRTPCSRKEDDDTLARIVVDGTGHLLQSQGSNV